jgi:hypothetical protein
VQHPTTRKDTVLYLAYGSNLCNQTFRGKRGIVPLSQVNVQVPSLRLTFDLPGVPYVEPCFANSGLREVDEHGYTVDASSIVEEKSPLLTNHGAKKDYRKNAWKKGLVGVVYEVTAEDYAHIIATEGGGSSYQDILVDCYPFASDDVTLPVPLVPDTRPFKAHTLFAPATPPGAAPPKDSGRFQRPDVAYAQASARYLKLITDGAAERSLPLEYQAFLQSLRPFTVTTYRQRIGQGIFLAFWMPILFSVFGLSRMFAGKNGRSPAWVRHLTSLLFRSIWLSYDYLFRSLFGEGERTIGDEKDSLSP